MPNHKTIKDKADDIKSALRYIYKEIEWMDENTDFDKIKILSDIIIEAAVRVSGFCIKETLLTDRELEELR